MLGKTQVNPIRLVAGLVTLAAGAALLVLVANTNPTPTTSYVLGLGTMSVSGGAMALMAMMLVICGGYLFFLGLGPTTKTVTGDPKDWVFSRGILALLTGIAMILICAV